MFGATRLLEYLEGRPCRTERTRGPELGDTIGRSGDTRQAELQIFETEDSCCRILLGEKDRCVISFQKSGNRNTFTND